MPDNYKSIVAGAASRSWPERMIIGTAAGRLPESLGCDILVGRPTGFDAGS